ncbi:MAG: hypothetical protein HY319_18740 [Armatimonadetes bacterium]|nr:hypothetical protein [Armatimonadota bacterium]
MIGKSRWLAPRSEDELADEECADEAVCAMDLSRAFSGAPAAVPRTGRPTPSVLAEDFFRILHGRWQETALVLTPEQWESMAGDSVKQRQAGSLSKSKARSNRRGGVRRSW